MVSGISLANKCQLLFGFAIVLILMAALSVPWIRTSMLVDDSQLEVSRQAAEVWLANARVDSDEGSSPSPRQLDEFLDQPLLEPLLRITLVPVEKIDLDDEQRPFVARALRRFQSNPELTEHLTTASVDGAEVYRYARALRESQLPKPPATGLPDPGDSTATTVNATDVAGGAAAPQDAADPLRAILLVDRTSQVAQGQLVNSRVFIIAAGIIGSLLAGLVFYLILTKLILSPVRRLRETTEKVQSGDLRIRSQIKTGDEFEQLSEAFNSMLERLEQGQAQLRAINQTLDLKLSELSEANVGLYESNRFKSEFLANVSHELRTPLNSIIGFAELLEEMAQPDPDSDPKRARYVSNILTSGRSLLEMINELLDMAKIEAGRMEVSIEPTSVGDLIEGLVGIMRPQAEAKSIEIRTVIGQRLPAIETDPGKLQQILYNFLSNAIKFTPKSGTVTISADRVTRQDNSLGVRLAVADTGPGIPYDMQDVIFEKFRQIDASHTREHAGTGLGLAICRELAQMLGAAVSFVSEPGRGATFFVDLPLTHQPQAPQPLMSNA
ncbi:MAG: HAMP domain-containing histidine kinase [Phycisphaerales bacterium]|nr:HAMP domain-containing histidine kinase [Phycisphaerales bacterium]MCI0631238.1 HAMP domain-containing histidine kinase [Phycisphaerales bacterium]MCI0677101.1 HAMP domain-containing histidine kinase [Phycisphaerales bacterium]